MKKIWALILGIFAIVNINAQTTSTTLGKGDMFADGKPANPDHGNVTVQQDIKLKKLINRYIRHNDAQKGFSGWRVHLFFGTGYGAKEKANSIKANFSSKNPNIPVYIIYEAPYFKVRVGDFRRSEKNKAYELKKSIEGKYPNSWIVADRINYPKLYSTSKQDRKQEDHNNDFEENE